MSQLERWLSETAERNVDNVARTDSYLALYAWTRVHGRELPWVLMAHLVSRNAGYLMTDLARQLDGKAGADAALAAAMQNLFGLLERANFVIFEDAWHHVLSHLLGRPLEPGRVPRFMIDAWARHDPAEERPIVLDLVHNEQHMIEHRAVHHPELVHGRRLFEIIEMTGREKPLEFPAPDAPQIKVSGFSQVARRIDAGRKIFDEVVADRDRRDRMFTWAMAHPHTGDRAVHGGKPGPTLRDAWPVARARAAWAGVHLPIEPDPTYP